MSQRSCGAQQQPGHTLRSRVFLLLRLTFSSRGAVLPWQRRGTRDGGTRGPPQTAGDKLCRLTQPAANTPPPPPPHHCHPPPMATHEAPWGRWARQAAGPAWEPLLRARFTWGRFLPGTSFRPQRLRFVSDMSLTRPLPPSLRRGSGLGSSGRRAWLQPPSHRTAPAGSPCLSMEGKIF